MYNRAILVAGGAGLIGHQVCKELIRRGATTVVLLDTFQSAASRLQPVPAGVLPFNGSVLDRDLLKRMKRKYRPATIFHLASVVGVTNVLKKTEATVLTNTQGTINLLNVLEGCQKPTFVYVSTSEIYGKNDRPCDEFTHSVLGPSVVSRWSYAYAKLAGETLVQGASIEGSSKIIIRPFNVSGGPQRDMVIPNFVKAALLGKPIIVHDDGGMVRCFSHAEDVARGIVDLAELWEVGIYNIGDDKPITIRTLAERVIELTKSESSVEFKPYEAVFGNRFDECRIRLPDLSRIRKRVKYRCRKNLNDIIKDVAENVKCELESKEKRRR